MGILFVVSCRWESDEDFIDPCNSSIVWTLARPDTCFDLPITPLGFVDATTHWPIIRLPNYCPYDANRFVYVHEETNPEGNLMINTANLCNGEKQFLTSSDYLPYPQWGATDWIIFGNRNGQLYRIMSNGDSISLLSPPEIRIKRYLWINDGHAIYTRWRDSSLEYNIIINTTGEIIDTIPEVIGLAAYKNNLLAVWGFINDQVGIYVGSVENWVFTLILPFDSNILPTSINWLDNETIIWSTRSGLFKVNIFTNEVTTIKETPCDNMGYGPVTAAPDGSGKVLTTRG
jgi:hypothetical protein